MDNIMPNSESDRLADANKRKRRGSTHLDDSIKKKATLHSVTSEDNESDTFITTEADNLIPESPQTAIDVKDNKDEFNQTYLLEDFCDEILYEIFKFLDTWSLMSLMNVCKRFQKFILDKRLWETIDLSQQPLPLGILEDKLERTHSKTKCIKLRGPSPCQHIEGEIQHFNKTIQNSLTTRCTKLTTLELFGVTLDFNQITLKDFPQTLKRLVLNTCNVRMADYKSLFTGIETILINLEELAIEYNSWFDPYYVMALSKLPILHYLSLRGCSQMNEFIPYGSIAARHGFKKLEILDLSDTPLNDSDLQSFNVVETLKEIYLKCPEIEHQDNAQNNQIAVVVSNKIIPLDGEKPSSSNDQEPSVSSQSTSKDSGNNICARNVSAKPEETPLTPTSQSLNDNEPSSSSFALSTTTSSTLSTSPTTSSGADNNTSNSSPIVVPVVGTNTPHRSRFLPRSDHIFVDVRNRTTFSPLQFNNYENYRILHQPGQAPVIEQMMRQNIFWDIVNPLGRVVGVGGPDRLFGEENETDPHTNRFSVSTRPLPRGTITDRGVCCFGRSRQPVDASVIWIRCNNNRPSENRFERFSVRDYKRVTDISLLHLVQCSPHLIFLDVSGTSVTYEGLKHFKSLKPECKVIAEHL